MIRSKFVVMTCALTLPLLAGIDEELAAAAKSPYEIARFVDNHVTFDLAPLWSALGIKDQMVVRCGDSSRRTCHEE